ncbi:heterokaryon incompatibility protein-domain-containing protein [Schizothecium vesticola]|uniref:Heterokaryon incompatibility protein-domain-containing protein n=1 Tax=Schizothecium vesticola TaxID=314040 RepID=A0AA40BR47_9PEZI|nr:heterokaryon incompatibility protein-domain-containing protein [Schizothecium vesticola]
MRLFRRKKAKAEPSTPLEGVDLWTSWIVQCNALHPQHCAWSAKEKDVLHGMPNWLIDVERVCIVPAEPHYRYLTLSYVWGKLPFTQLNLKNLPTMQVDGAFSDTAVTLPKTITEAIEVVRSLGERFLWVDALCIVQDDVRTKEAQLQGMAAIYAKAYLTIVAAGGSDANHGLFGPETGSRGDKQTMYTTWARRGWTYQENLFSRRKLIFRARGVEWVCHCAEMDSLYIGLKEATDMKTESRCTVPTSVSGLIWRQFPDLTQFARLVFDYNQRELTKSSDVADPLKGIFTTLACFFPGGFLWGMPYMFFDITLLWQPKEPVQRREDGGHGHIPSWSWMGWQGKIDPESWIGGCEYIRKNGGQDPSRDSWRQNTPWHPILTSGKLQMDFKPVARWRGLETPLCNYQTPEILSTVFQYRDMIADQKGMVLLPPGWKRHKCKARDRELFDDQFKNPVEDLLRVGPKRYPAWYYTFDPEPSVSFWYPIPARYPPAQQPLAEQFPYLSCQTSRCWLRLSGQVRGKDHSARTVSLYTESRRWAGVIRLNQQADGEYNLAGTPCELIALSSGAVPNYELARHERYMEEYDWDVAEERRATAKAEPGGFQILYEFYNVMWIERGERDVAYRKAVGRVKKSIWDKLATECIDIVLG